jgi:hypothetical protein
MVRNAMDRIRIGVTGTGYPGRFHFRKWLKVPGCRVNCDADTAEENTRKRGKILSLAAEGPPDGTALKARVRP